MKSSLPFSLSVILLASPLFGQNLLTNCRDVTECCVRSDNPVQRFCVTGTVTFANGLPHQLPLADASGACMFTLIRPADVQPIHPGELITISGTVSRSQHANKAFGRASRASGTPLPVKPVRAKAAEIQDGVFDFRPVILEGVVQDAFPDEIDPNFTFLVLSDETGIVYVALSHGGTDAGIAAQDLMGARVRIDGTCSILGNVHRKQMGRTVASSRNTVKVLTPPSSDPFLCPALEKGIFSPTQLSNFGRRKISGQVVAVRNSGEILLKSSSGDISSILPSDKSVPRHGTMIEAAGFPETDLYHLNFSRAIWRLMPKSPCNPVQNDVLPQKLSVRQIVEDKNGVPRFDGSLHGACVSLTGFVRLRTHLPGGTGTLLLDDNGHLITVECRDDAKLPDDLREGCLAEATGICALESDNWRPRAAFPRIKAATLILNAPEDIRIIRHPPWWSIQKILVLLVILVAATIFFALWTILLKRVAERRGRELAAESFAHAEADLKVYERTRLAVELHDALSQNLTGIAMEVDVARRLSRTDPVLQEKHLLRAARTLKSCRDELRNCLWDLRNNSLELANVNESIRRTLEPHVGECEVTVRFNVERERLSDNTLHTILCIIRELATNAVRHGKAHHIRIAGAIEALKLKFSVRDDGYGFDPVRVPTVRDGHFGLQGIRERVDGFEGSMRIDSKPGQGTKVTVELDVPQESKS